ncbi:hypothetical protein HNR16_003454 [Pseudoclavibacter chungangensis]|nr:hypothetical protein [Pseudoclavibacter chungangensis]
MDTTQQTSEPFVAMLAALDRFDAHLAEFASAVAESER